MNELKWKIVGDQIGHQMSTKEIVEMYAEDFGYSRHPQGLRPISDGFKDELWEIQPLLTPDQVEDIMNIVRRFSFMQGLTLDRNELSNLWDKIKMFLTDNPHYRPDGVDQFINAICQKFGQVELSKEQKLKIMALQNFAKQAASVLKDVPPDIVKIVDENFWNLVEVSPEAHECGDGT